MSLQKTPTHGIRREVRVFISSTFSDMQAERDYLIKVVFPVLRERLEQYSLDLVDVDLRWGVTGEQVENDQALDICLRQIDRCRPFFINLLGERYGYVARTFSDEVLSRYQWVGHHRGKSITELEILHGALGGFHTGQQAFFYLRDPAVLTDIPPALLKKYVETSRTRKRKLDDLKMRIRQSGFPVMDCYPARWGGGEYDRISKTRGRLVGLEAFGERVCKDLWESFKKTFNLSDCPPLEAEQNSLAVEAQLHERFAGSRLRVYVGRRDIRQQLSDYLEGDARRPLLLVGEGGSGKSAVLANLHRTCGDNFDVSVAHFTGASPASTSSRMMLWRLCQTLQTEFGVEGELPRTLEALETIFGDLLRHAPPGRKVLIIVDAIDQLDDADMPRSLSWVPRLPPHIKLVLSCVDAGGVSGGVLERARRLDVIELRLPPLTDDEQRKIISEVPSLSAKALDARQTALLLGNPATGNPLFLTVALEELRVFGSFEELNDRIDAFPRGSDAAVEIFQQVLERLESDFGAALVELIFALLASARRGLTEGELRALLRGVEHAGDLLLVLRQARAYLLSRAGIISFYHRNFLEAVSARYLTPATKKLGLHTRLASFFSAQPFWLDETTDNTRQANTRKADEVVWQCLKAGRWDEAEELLTDISFLEAKSEAGAVFDLADDFSESLRVMPPGRPRRHVLRVLERGLGAELHFIVRHPTTLFQCLWNNCWWYDCSASESRGERRQERAPDVPKVSDGGGEVSKLLEHWRERKRVETPGYVWLRSLRPPQYRLSLGLRFVLRGHRGSVTIAASSDGRRIASASSEDNTVRIWDANTGHELLRYENLPCPLSLAFSPDGSCLAVGMLYHEIHLLDTYSRGEIARLYSADQALWGVSFSPDGKSLAVGCMGLVRGADREILQHLKGTIRVWDVATQAVRISMYPHGDYVKGIAFSPDGCSITSGADDGTVRLWNVSTGAQLACWKISEEGGRDAKVMCVSFSPDGRRIAAGSSGGDVWVWEVTTGELIARCVGHESLVSSVCFTPDGERLVSGSGDTTIHLWDAFSGARLHVLHGHLAGVSSVACLPGGRRLASGSTDMTVRIWEPTDEAPDTAPEPPQTIRHLAASPDGRLLATADGVVRVWDAEGKLLASGDEQEGWVYSLAFAEDGQTLAAAYSDQTILLWHAGPRANSAFTRQQLWGAHDIPESIIFSQDVRRCAMIVFTRAKARVWDTWSGKELATFFSQELDRGGEPLKLRSLAFSPDGKHLALGTDACSISPDGRLSVGGSIDVWRIEDGVHKAHLRAVGSSVTSLAFSPNAARLAAGYEDRTVRIWDIVNETFVACVDSHQGAVTEIAFSCDGQRVASADGHRLLNVKDFTLRLWDAHTGECLETVGGSKEVRTLADDFPRQWQACATGMETLIQSVATGEVVAWYSGGFHQLLTIHPGRRWAGVAGSQFSIFSLEREA